MENQNVISVAEFAAALGLDPKSGKEEVLARLASLSSRPDTAPRKRWKLSTKYKSREEYEELRRQEVRVRVKATHPIAENGEVFSPEERDTRGKITKPADVFITNKARLRKIAWCVEEVPSNTPTTAELRAKEKADKN